MDLQHSALDSPLCSGAIEATKSCFRMWTKFPPHSECGSDALVLHSAEAALSAEDVKAFSRAIDLSAPLRGLVVFNLREWDTE